jgi:Relaxase/Mobilisation nuclease domain
VAAKAPRKCRDRCRPRAPQVIVKVIIPGSNDLKAISQHLHDLQHGHDRSLETDFFRTPVAGVEGIAELIDDWSLELDEIICRYYGYWGFTPRAKPSKLVHKIVFSMPAGTPADKVMAATRDFAEAEFEPIRHRYVLALHTDDRHPHVHAVVKAISEEGERLHIRKATLRAWRRAFARHLRSYGIACLATRGSVRKDSVMRLKGMHRPVNLLDRSRSGSLAA